MSKVLNNIRNVDPNDSDAVKDAVSAFFSNLPNYTETDCNTWLRAVGNVINRFPKFCGSHRPTIEKYLAHFLDSVSSPDVIEAAKCAHVLQQVKPSQDKAATPKSCWREQMFLLCNAAHALIKNLFAKSVDLQKISSNQETQDIQILLNTPLTTALQNIDELKSTDSNILQNKKAIISLRLRNVFIFIQAMLVEIYPVAKPIRPQAVLEVILQAVSITDVNNKRSDSIISMKTEVLKLLDALVVCLGANLMPFSALVLRLIMQTLRWTGENNAEKFKKIRCAAYSSLVRWLNVLHVHKPSQEGRGKLWEDELTDHIMSDITPPKRVIEINVNAAIPTKNLSKKAKRKMANTMLRESSMAAHMPSEKNKINVSEEISDEVAIAALECAETFFIVCGIFLKPATHKVFQERLVRECFAIDSYSEERGLSFLRSLEAARKSVPPAIPPPTQYCLQVYSQLINHQTEISRFCSQALLDIRLQLHCSPPSLNFALEIQPETEKRAKEKRNAVSKRNREVLESLLGAERIPSHAIEDDVISIPDEPSVKKSRQELDGDQISLSSASIKSIDGSYDSDVLVDYEKTANIAHNITMDELNNYDVETIAEITAQEDAEVSRDVTDKNNCNIIEITEEGVESKSSNVKNNDNIHPILEETNETKQPSVNTEEVLTQIDETETPIIEKTQIAETTITDMDTQLPDDNAVETQATNVTVDETLPNTDETNDSELTCGQVCQKSPNRDEIIDVVELKIDENIESDDVPTKNGIHSSPENIRENGDVEEEKSKCVQNKTIEMSVEDMLADFVDEVIEVNEMCQ